MNKIGALLWEKKFEFFFCCPSTHGNRWSTIDCFMCCNMPNNCNNFIRVLNFSIDFIEKTMNK